MSEFGDVRISPTVGVYEYTDEGGRADCAVLGTEVEFVHSWIPIISCLYDKNMTAKY